MRFPDNSLIGDLNDNFSAKTSGSINSYPLSTTNENETSYDLLPVTVNRPPIIVSPITEASNPPIKPYATADATGQAMYLFPDGSVKVNLGVDISLSVKAQQPDVLNVENGIPKMLPPTSNLTYVWRKDGILLSSYDTISLRASLTINGDTIIFKNTQPEHAGLYTCDISNDIGTITSEPITLEVLNLDFDSYFYKNLIQNPYGIDGTDEWNSLSTDLITKNISKISSQELTKTNRVDLFGYTMDTMHPRPYQIDTGVIKNLNMTDSLLSDKASYFTRSRYKLIKDGGSFLVRAYQDVDVTDLQALIKGGVYGIEGVRAFFSCYIGNAVSNFIPVKELALTSARGNIQNYVASKPRLSVENFLNSGPSFGPRELVYVSIEEFNNETRLPSRLLQLDNTIKTQTEKITLMDPWNKGMMNNWSKRAYVNDVYRVGLSPINGIDATLLTAQELYPNENTRFTYGQYAEFNKIVLERLNPNTTKVRITLNFESNDIRLLDYHFPIRGGGSDEPYEVESWEQSFKRHSWFRWNGTWAESVLNLQLSDPKVKDKPYKEVLPTINEPRGMITALNLSLIPILTQKPQETKYYTDITLKKNNTAPSTVDSGLLSFTRPYDPNNILGRELRAQFKMYSDNTVQLNEVYQFYVEDRIELAFTSYNPSSIAAKTADLAVDADDVFPFKRRDNIIVETTPTMRKDNAEQANQMFDFRNYLGYTYRPDLIIFTDNWSRLPDYNKFGNITPLPSATESIQRVFETHDMTIDGNQLFLRYGDVDKIRTPKSENGNIAEWSGKSRYLLYFVASGSGVTATNLLANNVGYYKSYSETVGLTSLSATQLQSYYLTMDFENPLNKKITLSRDANLFPGEGAGSFDLEYSIDSSGVLVCRLPKSLLMSTATTLGGLKYPIYTGSISYTNEPTKCLDALYANLGIGSKVSLLNNIAYRRNLKSVVKPIEDAIVYQLSGSSALPKLSTPFSTTILSNYSSSLVNYAYTRSNPPSNAAIETFFADKSKIEIDLDKDFISYELSGSALTQAILDAEKAGYTIRYYGNSFINEYGVNLGPTQTKTVQVATGNRDSSGRPIYTNQIVNYVIVPDQTDKPAHLNLLRNPTSQLSLAVVKSTEYESSIDRVGTPNYGTDKNGAQYEISYPPVQDSFRGTYKPYIQTTPSVVEGTGTTTVTTTQAGYDTTNP